MKTKLTLNDLAVKSFQTSLKGGLEVYGEQYDTIDTGICTCLMFCASDPRLNCTQVCPDEVGGIDIQQSGRC